MKHSQGQMTSPDASLGNRHKNIFTGDYSPAQKNS